ncbi:MAG: 1-acyl-sn-glycerol-3-phosphate acyltransferase [Clostridiales bacterium]|nr:1-acyl-sn-glycerol-3-phosphate acyltransferase [Clostridiales bacterium]
MFFWIIKVLLFLPLCLIFPTSFKNKKKIPKGKVILVCNHRSNIDCIYLINRLWRRQYFLAKESLFKKKVFGGFLKKMGAVPVDREKVQLSTIKQCLGILKQEKLLTIFPEGTRNTSSEFLLDFKGGASVFSIKANCPVVPVVITKKPRAFCFNKIVVGDPIYFDDSFKGEDGTARANEIIKQKMIELYENNTKKKKPKD